MPEATGDDGRLGAGARRGNAAPRPGARRATSGPRGARVDAPRARGATRRTGADAPTRARPLPPALPRPSEFAANANLKDIHFEFDKYDIRPEAAKILDANATWLKANRAQSRC